MRKLYVISDWHGNILFPDERFKTPELAWGFAYKNIDNLKYERTLEDDDDVFEDIFVVIEDSPTLLR